MLIIQKIGLLILISAPLSIYLYTFCHQINYSNLRIATRTIFSNSVSLNNIQTETEEPAFTRTLNKFEWNKFQLAVKKNNNSEISEASKDLITKLVPFLIMEPKTAINMSCKPSPLKTAQEITCNKTAPKKIGILIQFGFDVDVLEIHLNELFDVVDKFFILESSLSHFQSLEKPLLWEIVKHQTRFQKFHSKVVHFTLDDSDTVLPAAKKNSYNAKMEFVIENLQERLRWEKFLEWNKVTQYFGDSDILGFGDVDEIPSREVVNYLKYCKIESDPLDIGIWFPFGNIDHAFISDFPVYSHMFTLGDPTFWTLASAKNINKTMKFHHEYPSRNRGRSDKYLLGGMHMTHYGYLPYQLVKRLTQSEGNTNLLSQVAEIQEKMQYWTLEQLERFYADYYLKPFRFRIFKLKTIKDLDPDQDKIVKLPWFYDCNRLRYPAWTRNHDTRLD